MDATNTEAHMDTTTNELAARGDEQAAANYRDLAARNPERAAEYLAAAEACIAHAVEMRGPATATVCATRAGRRWHLTVDGRRTKCGARAGRRTAPNGRRPNCRRCAA
jgi:hypothetical protein